MSFSKYIAPSVLVFFLSLSWGIAQPPTNDPLSGQDSLVLENDRIVDVIDSDKPFIKPPYQDIEKGQNTQMDYQSKSFYVETDFEPSAPDIKPLAKQKKEKLLNNYLQLGIGRYITPTAKVYLNNGRNRDYDLGLQFNHISAHGDELPLREFREDYGSITGSRVEKDFVVQGGVDFYNTKYFGQYADTNLVPTNAPDSVLNQLRDSLGRSFTRFGVNVNLMSNSANKSSFLYDVGTGVRFIRASDTNNEFHFDVEPYVGYKFNDEFSAGLATDLMISRSSLNDSTNNRFWADLVPGVRYNNGDLSVNAAVRFNFFSSNIDSNKTFLGPVIEARYAVVPETVTISAGYTSGLRPNNYYDLIFENRYLATELMLRPTTEKMNIYGGVQGNVGDNIDYTARIYYKQIENQYIFSPDITNHYFTIGYDSLMTVIGIHLEGNYDLNEQLRAGVALNINSFNTSTFAQYYNASPLRLDIYGTYMMLDDKLRLNGEILLYGPAPTISFEGVEGTRSIFPGINLAADYRIVDQFSVFLQLRNLTSTKFERWTNYPERGIDFRGGVSLSF